MPICPEQLAALPLFANLGAAELLEIVAACELRVASAGTPLVVEGHGEQTPLCVLLVGRATTHKWGADGRRHLLSELEAPAIFGEMDVLAQRPPLTSVVALTQVQVAQLTPANIERLCGAASGAILKVLRNLTTSLRYRSLTMQARLLAQRSGPEVHLSPLHRVLYCGWRQYG